MSGAVAGGAAGAPAGAKLRFSAKRLLLAGAGLAALVGVAVYADRYWRVGQYIQTTDDAYVGGDVTDLAPRVSGLIADVAVTDNQEVRAGDLLVKLDDRDFRIAVDKAQAAVAGEQANLANLAAMRVLQLALIAEAQADVASARARTVLARLNQDRYARLAVTEAGTLQDAQTAEAGLEQAEAAGDKAQSALAAAQAQLAVIAAQRQQAQAGLAGAQADLAAAQQNLSYTEIRAPFDGVIGNRSAHLGGYASEAAQLVSIVPARGLWVDANFKEDQLADMQPGDRVSISADVLPGVKITGEVASLAPASGAVFSVLPAENATGNFTKIVQRVPVRILLDGSAGDLGLLRPGLSVTASVDTRAP
jgi:membrane fusion protein (multidrug efflux system)